jgi:hypothetical protein
VKVGRIDEDAPPTCVPQEAAEAGVDDFDTAVATYRATCERWPQAKITLRQGARVVKKNWR